jgi:hypothetical protein
MIKIYKWKHCFILIVRYLSFLFFQKKGHCFIKGNVQVSRNSKSFEKVQKGAVLISGDTIKTGSRSLAIVKSPRTSFKIMQNSQMTLVFKKNGKQVVDLQRGGALIKLNKSLKKSLSSDALTVRTKTASVGVRGTTFMTYSGKENQSILSVKEGLVDFKGQQSGKAVKVGAKKSTMTNKNNQNLKPRSFGLQSKINWSFDPKDDLSQPKEFFTHTERIWSKYKEEQEFIWNNYKKEQNDTWKKFINN